MINISDFWELNVNQKSCICLPMIDYHLDSISSGMMKLKCLTGILEIIKESHCEVARTLKSPLVESEKVKVSNNPNFSV